MMNKSFMKFKNNIFGSLVNRLMCSLNMMYINLLFVGGLLSMLAVWELRIMRWLFFGGVL